METKEPKSWAGAMLRHHQREQEEQFKTFENLQDWTIDQCGEYYYGPYHQIFGGTMSLHFCIDWMTRFNKDLEHRGFKYHQISRIITEHKIIDHLFFVYQHPREPKTIVNNIFGQVNMENNNTRYELRGYDRYDSAYYRIGVYNTYQEALAAMNAEKAKQSNNCENDMLEINTIIY